MLYKWFSEIALAFNELRQNNQPMGMVERIQVLKLKSQTHTHTLSHSHSYAVNLSIGIALYLTLHPLCLEQLRYVDEILPGSGKDRWRNTNQYSPNPSPFTYVSFPQSLIGR